MADFLTLRAETVLDTLRDCGVGDYASLITSSHHAQAKWQWRPLGRELVCGPGRTQSPRHTGQHRHVAGRRDVAAALVGIQGGPAEELHWAWRISRYLHVLVLPFSTRSHFLALDLTPRGRETGTPLGSAEVVVPSSCPKSDMETAFSPDTSACIK